MGEVILTTVSGEDRPGISASLLGIFADHDAKILDIGQAVIHQTLSLGILVHVPSQEAWTDVAKELLLHGDEMGLKIKFTPISGDEYAAWVDAQGKKRHIITLLGRTLKAEALAGLTDIVYRQGLNINVITRLSGRVPLGLEPDRGRASVELSLSGEPNDGASMKAELVELSNRVGVDIAFQVDDVFRRNRRLVVFDMDSTLIQTEVIDDLAREAGVHEEVAVLTQSAMRGDTDFSESLRRRVALLKGLKESVLAEVAERLPLTEGAERLIAMLKHLGYKVAILSGGFTYFGRRLQERLGVDYMYANELEIVDGKLTGVVTGEIVDGPKKADLLREIVERENIRLEQVIAVGDGANDLPMLNIAGLGIAFNAKPVVAEEADHALSRVGLDGILYLIGVRDREMLSEFGEE